MRKVYGIVVLLAVLSFMFASLAWSQPGSGPGGGQGPGMSGRPGHGAGMGFPNRMYNPQTEETFTAVVEKVETSTTSGGRQAGLHLIVKTDQGTMPVHLGPSWYVEQQGVSFTPQDTVQVIGSRVSSPQGPMIIAREVKKGEKTLKLRQADGTPAWAGRGMRQPPAK